MRNLTLCLLAASIVTLTGCGLLGKKADADAGAVADEAGASAAAANPVVAGNSAAVARFGTEVPTSEGRKIASTTIVRTSPKVGTAVATLPINTEVTRVAINGTDSLITFSDPANPSALLMGWVTDAAFTAWVAPKKLDAGVHDAGAVMVVDAGPAPVAVVDAGPPAFSCPPGQSPVQLSVGKPPVCKKSCAQPTDCKNKVCSPATTPTKLPVKVCLAD